MFKKICCAIITLNVILSINSITYADDNDETILENDYIATINQSIATNSDITDEPNLNAKVALAYDRKSGKVIFGKNENKRTAMASTTKIMTAIILIENCNLDQTITVSSKSAGTGSRVETGVSGTS